jgi:hypothetical protein
MVGEVELVEREKQHRDRDQSQEGPTFRVVDSCFATRLVWVGVGGGWRVGKGFGDPEKLRQTNLQRVWVERYFWIKKGDEGAGQEREEREGERGGRRRERGRGLAERVGKVVVSVCVVVSSSFNLIYYLFLFSISSYLNNLI